MVKEIEVMDIFLINNINIYKMFGIHLVFIYLKKDVLLIADRFEKFISTNLKPIHVIILVP